MESSPHILSISKQLLTTSTAVRFITQRVAPTANSTAATVRYSRTTLHYATYTTATSDSDGTFLDGKGRGGGPHHSRHKHGGFRHVRGHESGAADAALGGSRALARWRLRLSRFQLSTIAPPARTDRILSRAPPGGGPTAAQLLECSRPGTGETFGTEQSARGRVELWYFPFGLCRTA